MNRVILFVALVTITPNIALGYVDPSSVQMVIQTLLAAGIGLLMFMGKIVAFSKSLFGKHKAPKDVEIPKKHAS